MKVLSLFDGMACGYEALKKAGFNIEKYYASEIDKYAIEVAKKNHPDIIEIGDVKNVRGGEYLGIDLLIGGSPCQGFSIAGKMLNFDDPRSKLFFEFVRILKEAKPKYFLLENVRMKKEWQDIITNELGVEPIMINSSLLSAQNRMRLYRTNIPGIEQPEDKGIVLKDILEENVDEKYYLTDSQLEMISKWKGFEKPLENIKTGEDKIGTLTTHVAKMSNGIKLVSVVDGEVRVKQATKQGYIVAKDGDGISLASNDSSSPCSGARIGKANTLTTQGESHVFRDKKIRKLTPIECERLQTLPDNYTEGVSESQRYKMLGNGWTVDVIAHIFSFING